jgi:hypothetical protein
LLVENADLGLQVLVARCLGIDHRVHPDVARERDQAGGDGGNAQPDEQRQLALTSFFIAPRK